MASGVIPLKTPSVPVRATTFRQIAVVPSPAFQRSIHGSASPNAGWAWCRFVPTVAHADSARSVRAELNPGSTVAWNLGQGR
jgi:hypothetical protein